MASNRRGHSSSGRWPMMESLVFICLIVGTQSTSCLLENNAKSSTSSEF